MQWLTEIEMHTLVQTRELRTDDWQHDVRKLIAAVRVAERALKSVTEQFDNNPSDVDAVRKMNKFACSALAQLQSGEFPKEEAR